MPEILQNVGERREEIKRYFEMTKLAMDSVVHKHELELVELLEKNVLDCLGE